MRKGGQKQKSNAHEREVAKVFTKAYYMNNDGEIRRTPMSGGWSKKAAPGDLIAYKKTKDGVMEIDRSFPLCPIECKNWQKKNVNFLFSGLYTGESIIYDWMKQAISDGIDANLELIPVVVFKFWKENVIMLLQEDYNDLWKIFGNPPGKIYRMRVYDKYFTIENWDLYFILLKEFINWIDWEHFK